MSFYTETLRELINGPIEEIIMFLQQKGILKRNILCRHCGCLMHKVKATRHFDKYVYKCMEKTCLFYKTTRPIRAESVIEGLSISLNQFLSICWCWFNDDSVKQAMEFSGCADKTIIKVFDKLRERAITMLNRNNLQLGGQDIVVQIDESMFRHKPKNHRGRATDEEIWVFGLVDTSFTPSKGYMCIVPDRSQNTLLPIIQQVCLPGTIIWSDEWRGYYNITRNLNFVHATVNHRRNFVDRETGTNTQAIESYWAKQKKRIKEKKGIKKEKLELYLKEWMFRDNVLKKDFDIILIMLRVI